MVFDTFVYVLSVGVNVEREKGAALRLGHCGVMGDCMYMVVQPPLGRCAMLDDGEATLGIPGSLYPIHVIGILSAEHLGTEASPMVGLANIQ
jgi:hypothetical protein